MVRIVACVLLSITMLFAKAQDNYEIQVYGSETVEKGRTMLELHSNYTLSGSHEKVDGVLPTNHIIHETIEITHGFTDWFEIGFYVFTSIGNADRTGLVGAHIRPRVSIPAKWKWPVGLSLSAEYGLQKKQYAGNTRTLEVRPIIDKKVNRLYMAFNPVFDKSFKGIDAGRGFIFSPNAKVSYDINKKVALGLEYYGSTGPFFHFDNFQQQQHQLFGAVDLNINPLWEFNAGLGYGLTNSTDRSIFKLIVGRKI